MDARKREIRNVDSELSYREATTEEAAEGILGTISGRAIVFESESEILDEGGQLFREVITREAITQEWVDTQDVKINMLHNRELTFGRSKRGKSGNARIMVREDGVYFEVDIPNCDLGIRVRELSKAGVYDGCSFEFIPDKYEVIEREGRIPQVRHTKFRGLYALTCGMDPAYKQTTLSARELWQETPTAQREAEEAKVKAEEDAKKEAEHNAAIEREREKVRSAQAARDRYMEILNLLNA